MISIAEATPTQASEWLDGWRSRLEAWYARADIGAEWTRGQVDRRVDNHVGSAQPFVFVLADDGVEVGRLAAARITRSGPPSTVITDIWIEPQHRRQGHATAALRWAHSWAAPFGEQLILVTDPADPAQTALAAAYPVRAQNMYKRVSDVDTIGPDLDGQAMTGAEYDTWRARQASGYAEEIASAGLLSPADARQRAEEQLAEFLPDGVHTVNNSFWLLRRAGTVVADLWLVHHYQPDTTWISAVEVDEAHRGKGYGRSAMLLAERATAAGSDTHLGLNVFGHNTVAINLYQRLGYLTIQQSRSVTL